MAPILITDSVVYLPSTNYFFLYFVSFMILSTIVFVLFLCCGKEKQKPAPPMDAKEQFDEFPQETPNEPEPNAEVAEEVPNVAPVEEPLPSEEKSVDPSQIGSLQLQSVRSSEKDSGYKNQSYNKNPGFENNVPSEKLASLRLVSLRTGSEQKSVATEVSPKNVSSRERSKSASHASTLGSVSLHGKPFHDTVSVASQSKSRRSNVSLSARSTSRSIKITKTPEKRTVNIPVASKKKVSKTVVKA